MNISKGKKRNPVKVVLYGPEGIGKSTFASKFPGVVFIDTEGSTTFMDVDRIDGVKTWDEILKAIEYAIKNRDTYGIQTLAIDTADWAELMAITKVCERHNVNGLEDIGYGKGYTYLQETFKTMLDKLDMCIAAGINTIITAHAKMRKFEQPDEMGAYDRWEMKLTKQVAPMLKEWADMVLFANYKTVVVEDSKTKSKKAQGGKRVMYTTHHSCWDAKNRFDLDDQVDFSFDAIKHIVPDMRNTQEEKKEPKETKKSSTKIAEEKKDDGNWVNIPEALEESIQNNAPEQVSLSYATLKQLMDQAHITDDEVQTACVNRGLQNPDLAVWDYPEEFIDNMLIAKFKGFSSYIAKEIKSVPFIRHWDEITKEEK